LDHGEYAMDCFNQQVFWEFPLDPILDILSKRSELLLSAHLGRLEQSAAGPKLPHVVEAAHDRS